MTAKLTNPIQFTDILRDLHTLVSHETTLLKDKKVAQAMDLLPEKERLVSMIDANKPPIDLLPDEDLRHIKELSLKVQTALEENQKALAQTHQAHEQFVQFCIHTVKNLKPLAYTKDGSIALPQSDSIGINKKF